MSCNRHYLNLHLRQFFPASVIFTILHVLNSSHLILIEATKIFPRQEKWNLNCIREVFSLWKLFLSIWSFVKGKFRVRFFSSVFPLHESVCQICASPFYLWGVFTFIKYFRGDKNGSQLAQQAKQVLHLLQKFLQETHTQTQTNKQIGGLGLCTLII